MNFSPSIMSCIGLPVDADSILGTCSSAITIAISRNPDPAMKKAAAVPIRLIANPAAIGAMILTPDQIAEFSATALVRTFRSIR